MKVLQAAVLGREQPPVLDVSQVGSTVVATIPLEHHTSIAVAELFCGGFSGWSQGVHVLHRAGLPIHMAWRVDNAPEVVPMLTSQEPGIQVLTEQDQFELQPPPAHTLLLADIQDCWWLRAFSQAMPQLVTISAPCPAWSVAGFSRGLTSQEGKLMLRAADICGAMQPKAVLLEQVEGFPKHADYSAVMCAWASVGFTVQWKATLDLLDVLPTSRKRFLAVLTHTSVPGVLPRLPQAWSTGKRPTLQSASALFKLPDPLLEALCPRPEALKLYLCPAFIPKRTDAVRAPDPQRYRVRLAGDTASCFMARYTRQHELPQSLLQDKGLMGTLTMEGGCIRFFGQPEVASMHGLVRPLRVTTQVSQEMLLLGNAIATPHAVAGLAQGLYYLGYTMGPTMKEAVDFALEQRIHASNSLLLPCTEEWLLCRAEHLPELFLRLSPPKPLQLCSPSPFQRCCFGSQQLSLQIATCLPASSVLAHLGLSELGLLDRNSGNEAVLSMPDARLPVLGCFEWCHANPAATCVSLLTEEQGFVLPHDAQTVLHLAQAGSQLSVTTGQQLGIFHPAGSRVENVRDLPRLCLGLFEDTECPHFEAEFSTQEVFSFQLQEHAHGFRWQVPMESATLFRLSFPHFLLPPLGWKWVEHLGSDPPATVTIGLEPQLHMPSLMPHRLRHLMRVWLFRAQLIYTTGWHALPTLGATQAVEVHVVSQCVWKGQLPLALTLADAIRMWAAASTAVRLATAARVFSGVAALADHLCLRDIAALSVRLRKSRITEALILTVHPEIMGGGAKTETKEWAQSHIAQVCLSEGMDLHQAPAFVDKLVAQSAPRKLQLLADKPASEQWHSIQEMAKAAGLEIPSCSRVAGKAEARIRKAQASKRLPKPPQVSVEDVAIAPGFFQHEDGTDAQIIVQMRPGASGVCLVSRDQAAAILDAMPAGQVDSLGLLVLGHDCPCSASCSGRVLFLGLAKGSNAPVLLAACLHNMGSSPVRTSLAHKGHVELPPISVCHFEAHAQDFEAPAWERLSHSPVRTVLELFAESGAAHAFSSPWSRRFTLRSQIPFHSWPRLIKAPLTLCLVCQGTTVSFVLRRRLNWPSALSTRSSGLGTAKRSASACHSSSASSVALSAPEVVMACESPQPNSSSSISKSVLG